MALNRDLKAERRANKTYADTWRYGGGSIFTTPAVDPELGLIYIGTGNPSPQMDDSTRPGDNLYSVSLVALEADTANCAGITSRSPMTAGVMTSPARRYCLILLKTAKPSRR